MALTVIFHSNYGVDETESVTTTTTEYLKQIEIFNGPTRVVAKEKLNDGVTYSVSLSKRLVR